MNLKNYFYFIFISAAAIVMALVTDTWFAQKVSFLQTPVLNPIFIFFGSSWGIGTLVILSGVVLWWKDRPKIKYFILAVLLAIGLSYALKYLILRPRPELFSLLVKTSPAFPSTHATVAASMYFLVNSLQTVEKSVLLLLGFLIAFSGYYNGVHYLSDIVAGIVLGLMISYVCGRRIAAWWVNDKKA